MLGHVEPSPSEVPSHRVSKLTRISEILNPDLWRAACEVERAGAVLATCSPLPRLGLRLAGVAPALQRCEGFLRSGQIAALESLSDLAHRLGELSVGICKSLQLHER